METSKYTTNSETDRVLSVFDTFKKDAENIKTSSANEAERPSQPVLTMSSLGQLGRFGNQIFQYAFLRICAQKSGATVECPPWIGQTLFGHDDAPISKRLPPAIERRDSGKNLFDIIPEFIPYLEKVADAKSSRVEEAKALDCGIVNVDLWGFFQIHTRYLQPYKEEFSLLFQPVSDLKSALEAGLNLLRSKGKTIIGIHIRRSDFITVPLAGFTLVVPSKWYCEWLDGIWGELEDPVLFVCSDDIDSILPDFEKFCPVASRDLNVKLPERIKDLNIEFYIDFFILSNCDVVGISNSIFSFTACMLNKRGKTFVRPHWDFSTKFTVFDPWNSKPLLYLGGERAELSKTFAEALYVTHMTQGIFGVLKLIFIYFPKSRIKMLVLRTYLGYQIDGIVGVVKTLLYTFGWRSVWKTPGLFTRSNF
ncbi:MAG: alpha-1,2-fucosyltransferase [Scytonema hyalinum WJT4-NPBG1]|jgi:hypothetical protein|nr:alpha-1,2-fucosyltransferase [Scytonema hyalinum WJT4-NPBG1]